jgi:octaprenyl-diphosphate synthase
MKQEAAGPGLLARVEAVIGPELDQVEQILARELQSTSPYVSDVYAHVSHFRGKRLRPILLLLSAQATGGINHNHRVLAAVVEIIHTATLIHDDVLDEAETRRHVATVNARWNNETSVLFGDYLFTHGFHLASSLESTLACRLIGRATNIVCEGELSQIHERGNFELSEQTYLQIIEAKTAELCALCGYLGAYFSGTDDQVVRSLEQYGRSLGVAFQIADDLLDLLGNEKSMGKSLGTDLVKQKLTLPLIRLISQANEAEAVQIRELLCQPGADTAAQLLSLLERSDALDYTRSRANELAATARESLTVLPDSPAKRILMDITEFVIHRAI